MNILNIFMRNTAVFKMEFHEKKKKIMEESSIGREGGWLAEIESPAWLTVKYGSAR